MGNNLHRRPVAGVCAGAIALVVASRIAPDVVPGGAFGVDVAFVAAGAVLADTPGDGVLDRWRRLLRRGLPAYVACITITLVATSMFLVDTTFTFRTGIAAALGGANGYLLYADAPVRGIHGLANPLTHLWAVGVGAQGALLVLALVRLGERGSPPRPWLPLAVTTAASGIAFLLLSPVARLEAFYLPPLRLWEIALGTFAGILADRWSLRPAWGWLGGLAVAAAVAHPHGLGPWPRVVAVGGVTLLIATLRSPPSPATAALGRRAYAAYLWHWPVICLVTQTIDRTPAHAVGSLAAIVALAEATVRLTATLRAPKVLPTVGGGAIATTGLVLLLSRWPPFLGDAPPHLWWYDDEACFSHRFDPERHPACLTPAAGDARRVFLLGDSHARMHRPAVRAAFPDAQVLDVAVGNGCGLLPPEAVSPAAEAFTHCRDFNAMVRSALKRHVRAEDLVIVGAYAGYVSTAEASAATADHLADLAEVVAPAPVLLLGDTPELPVPLTGLACQSHPWNRARPERCVFARGESRARLRHHDDALRRAARIAPNAHYVALHDLLCRGDRCAAYQDGVLLYLDDDHLTIEGSLLLTEPLRRAAKKLDANPPGRGSAR